MTYIVIFKNLLDIIFLKISAIFRDVFICMSGFPILEQVKLLKKLPERSLIKSD